MPYRRGYLLHGKPGTGDLDTFLNDREFYARIGMPYRRGYLLHGKPGTGKTSLINAISAHLNRDLYYINLRDISDDAQLNATFSSVPAGQMIVFEDIDTQSTDGGAVVDISGGGGGGGGGLFDKMMEKFALSTLLGNLDGHTLAEGTIIIMTTNHVEVLDPAVIRPGRMDLRLELGYASHLQIQTMYRA
ncbi:P-loop containing nucleoside triphosphate hydrolase protein, partial [Ramicandelaber brevisporus]